VTVTVLKPPAKVPLAPGYGAVKVTDAPGWRVRRIANECLQGRAKLVLTRVLCGDPAKTVMLVGAARVKELEARSVHR